MDEDWKTKYMHDTVGLAFSLSERAYGNWVASMTPVSKEVRRAAAAREELELREEFAKLTFEEFCELKAGYVEDY